MREGHEGLGLSHSQKVTLFDHSCEKGENENRVLTREFTFSERKVKILQQLMQLSRSRVIASVRRLSQVPLHYSTNMYPQLFHAPVNTQQSAFQSSLLAGSLFQLYDTKEHI